VIADGSVMTTGSLQAQYVLTPDWQPERARLALLEEIFDPGARDQLTSLGLGPGARCLEIGAGGGSITDWLCRQVGPTGAVTATDLDTRWLERLNQLNLTVLRHDVLVDEFAAGSFDFIYARAVFEHIADRQSVLERVCRWLAPGGWLYVQNFASFPLDSSSEPVYTTAYNAFADLIGQSGTDYAWARTFPKPLIELGLSDVGAAVDTQVMRGGSPIAQFISLTLQALTPRIVDMGIATQSDLDVAQRRFVDPDFWDLAPALIGAWGQRRN
jgi:trans-aconitate methyltransferase